MNLEFLPVIKERWPHFEQFFESRGCPHFCWCMVWRTNEYKKSLPGKVGKKASMKMRVEEGVPIGILAYSEGEPIAWCSIAPRDSHRPLGGDGSKEAVWSLTCFFIKRPFRHKGITAKLIDEAISYAKENEAKYVEAYPVDLDSPSYKFMGIVPMFEKAGFHFVKKAGTRRNVMMFETNMRS